MRLNARENRAETCNTSNRESLIEYRTEGQIWGHTNLDHPTLANALILCTREWPNGDIFKTTVWIFVFSLEQVIVYTECEYRAGQVQVPCVSYPLVKILNEVDKLPMET